MSKRDSDRAVNATQAIGYALGHVLPVMFRNSQLDSAGTAATAEQLDELVSRMHDQAEGSGDGRALMAAMVIAHIAEGYTAWRLGG